MLYQGVHLLHQQCFTNCRSHVRPFSPRKREADIRAGRMHDHPLFPVGERHRKIVKLTLLQRSTELRKILLRKIQQQVVMPQKDGFAIRTLANMRLRYLRKGPVLTHTLTVFREPAMAIGLPEPVYTC